MGTRTSIALALGTIMVFTAAASAQQPLPSYGSPGVTLEQAKKAAEAAEAEATKNGWKMAIAVVSNEGSLIYFGRMEDTQFGSSDVAIRRPRPRPSSAVRPRCLRTLSPVRRPPFRS